MATPPGLEDGPTRFGEASRSLLRTTVLRAVDGLVREQAWSSVSLAAVAKEAGVSRQTLYNEFGNRQELTRTYVLWAADDFLDQLERVVQDNAANLSGALIATVERFLELAADHPMVRAMVATSGADDLRSMVSTPAGEPLVVGASVRLAAIIRATWPTIPVASVDAASEVLVRLAISHATVPTGTPAEAAARLAVAIGPFLDELQTPGRPATRRVG